MINDMINKKTRAYQAKQSNKSELEKCLCLFQEFYYTTGATAFYFIAMIVQFAVVSGYDFPSGTAAAVSGQK